jgi:hypothetical protein
MRVQTANERNELETLQRQSTAMRGMRRVGGDMKSREILMGGRYLTKTITVSGIFGPKKTRGLVEVTGQVNAAGLREVKWLTVDGEERKDPTLPRRLPARVFLAEVGKLENA